MFGVSLFKERSRFAAIVGLVLACIALLLSGLLVCKHSGICVTSLGCEIDGVDGCAELAGSSYSRINIPFTNATVPIAWLGFFYYTLLLFLFLRLQRLYQKKGAGELALSLLTGVAIFGFIFELFLAYRNFFTLATPCLLCAYTYLCQFGIVLVAFWLYFSPQQTSLGKKTDMGSFSALWGELKAVRFAIGGTVLLGLLMVLVVSVFSGREALATAKADTGGLLKRSDVSRVLREFRALKTAKISVSGLSSYEGDAGAYITIHEWLDFRCPHCYDASKLIEKALTRWPGRIKAYYRYFPLDGNCNPYIKQKRPDAQSCKAAQAAICASRESYFPDFFHQLFTFQVNRTPITYGSLGTLTQQVGGKWEKIQSCMSSATTRAALSRDIQAAESIKISATPTLVLSDRLLPSGTPQEAWFFRILDALVLEKEDEAAIEDYENRKFINSR